MAPPPVTPIEVQQVSQSMIPTWVLILVFLGLFVLIYYRISRIMKTRMLAGQKNQAYRAYIQKFINIVRIILATVLVITVGLTYTQNFAALGISAGVLGAVFGWALQKPIEGVAAFFLITTRKPFRVGDRIDLEGMKGDVVDITMTHVYLEEVSGTTSGQDKSGRVAIIPTNILFDKKIINFTMNHEYFLDEVVVTFTYDSDLDKAVEMCIKAAEHATNRFTLDNKQEPFCRIRLGASGVDVYTRYYALVRNPHTTSTEILTEIFKKTSKSKRVKLAYPVTEVIIKKRKK